MPRVRLFDNVKSRYCKEDIANIENYELAKADNFKGWVIHHRDEIRKLPSGMIAIRSREDLIDDGRYFDCPANELIYMTNFEHQKLHSENRTSDTINKMSNSHTNKKASDATKMKMSKARKGKSHAFNGGWKHSDEWKVNAKAREHKKSAFYQKFGMTIEEYRKYNKLTCSCSTIYRMFKNGEI